MSSALLIEEVEAALIEILERLKEEGFIAAIARRSLPPVYPRAMLLLKEVRIERRTIGGSEFSVTQEYEIVIESSRPDHALQVEEVVRAAIRTMELLLTAGPRTVGDRPFDVFPYEMRRVELLESGRMSTLAAVLVRAHVGW
ncbi:MAG: hypothetical protein NZ957_00415 [Thaumarchaeota archaeon]|nr:hypothetical protein [Candidatus Calditenuaceae archaeon]MDW8041241.1 hypothetical protein [Nitrososphaerota archaeon]